MSETIDLSNLISCDDRTLSRAALIISHEIKSRALANCDPVAIIDKFFKEGFNSKEMPKDPVLLDDVLICMGAKLDKSVMNHSCAFVRVNNVWSWEHEDLIKDEIRYLPGAKSRMQSVSLIPVVDGTPVDLVESKTLNSVHKLVAVKSYVVEGKSLILVSSRKVSTNHNR